MTTQTEPISTICKIKIDNTDIFLEDFEKGQGKITISDTYGHNYSYYWGSMGGTLKDFILRIDSDYFCSNLLGRHSMYSFDAKGTFKNIRTHIREEIGLYWFQHMEFQKELREALKSFQSRCEENESDTYFVDSFFSSFVDRLDFYLIEDRWEQKRLKEEFNSISEHWYFINTKESRESIWLKSLHKKLKRKLKNKNA